jgi:hypothetical protein
MSLPDYMTVMLSPHLSSAEWIYNTAGVENIPSERQFERGKATANELFEVYRGTMGPTKCNSGFRSPSLNEIVGGTSQSAHQLGEAIDATPLCLGTMLVSDARVALKDSFDDLIARLRINNQTWDQLILYPTRLFIHMALKSDDDGQRARSKNRCQILFSPAKGRYRLYTKAIFASEYPRWPKV